GSPLSPLSPLDAAQPATKIAANNSRCMGASPRQPSHNSSAQSPADDAEVAGFGVVRHQRARRLFGDELVLVGEGDADAGGVEQFEELCLILEAGAGGVAEAVAAALVALHEEVLDGRRVGAGDGELV